MHSFSEFGKDEDYQNQLEYIRELISFDCRCPASFVIERCSMTRTLHAPYQPVSPLHWSRQFEWPWVLHHAELQSWHEVLDVGSGWSVLKYALAKRCHSVIALDNDEPSIQKTKESIRRMGFDNIAQLESDVRDMPFSDGRFDRVVCVSVLEHIPNRHEAAVKEMMRVLKPGGCLLLTMDIRIKGENKGDGNFFLDQKNAFDLCIKAGIPLPEDQMNAAASYVPNNDVGIVVLMSRIVKPL